MSSKAQHVVVISVPVQGHINPMLQFSKRLASKGVRVTILAPAYLTTSLQTMYGGLIQIECISEDDKPPHGIDELLEWFETIVSRSFRNLIDKMEGSGCPLKVVVYDAVLPWAQDLAQNHGLKGAAFFTQSCAVCGIYYLMYSGKLKVSTTENSSVSLPSIMPVMGLQDLPSFFIDTQSYPSLSKISINQSMNFQKAEWLLFNSFDNLEKEVVEWISHEAAIKTIGPTIPSMYLDKGLKDDKDYGMSLFKPNSEACIKWLDSRETDSVVYVSFGSLGSLGEKQMEELAWGLMRSNCYFLWVVRTSEDSKVPKDFKSKASEKGLIVNWCPQLDVLAHPATGCFMTHCGWNSTLEALSLGVPMVGMPQWSDQPTNAKYIMDVWETGIRVKGGEDGIVTREEIEGCIREVMYGEKGNILKNNALKWRELAKEAVDEGGTTDKNIDEFLSQLIK